MYIASSKLASLNETSRESMDSRNTHAHILLLEQFLLGDSRADLEQNIEEHGETEKIVQDIWESSTVATTTATTKTPTTFTTPTTKTPTTFTTPTTKTLPTTTTTPSSSSITPSNILGNVWNIVFITETQHARSINERQLMQLSTPEVAYNTFFTMHAHHASASKMFKQTAQQWTDQATLAGLRTSCNMIQLRYEVKKLFNSCGASLSLKLKVGAQVLLLREIPASKTARVGSGDVFPIPAYSLGIVRPDDDDDDDDEEEEDDGSGKTTDAKTQTQSHRKERRKHVKKNPKSQWPRVEFWFIVQRGRLSSSSSSSSSSSPCSDEIYSLGSSSKIVSRIVYVQPYELSQTSSSGRVSVLYWPLTLAWAVPQKFWSLVYIHAPFYTILHTLFEEKNFKTFLQSSLPSVSSSMLSLSSPLSRSSTYKRLLDRSSEFQGFSASSLSSSSASLSSLMFRKTPILESAASLLTGAEIPTLKRAFSASELLSSSSSSSLSSPSSSVVLSPPSPLSTHSLSAPGFKTPSAFVPPLSRSSSSSSLIKTLTSPLALSSPKSSSLGSTISLTSSLLSSSLSSSLSSGIIVSPSTSPSTHPSRLSLKQIPSSPLTSKRSATSSPLLSLTTPPPPPENIIEKKKKNISGRQWLIATEFERVYASITRTRDWTALEGFSDLLKRMLKLDIKLDMRVRRFIDSNTSVSNDNKSGDGDDRGGNYADGSPSSLSSSSSRSSSNSSSSSTKDRKSYNRADTTAISLSPSQQSEAQRAQIIAEKKQMACEMQIVGQNLRKMAESAFTDSDSSNLDELKSLMIKLRKYVTPTPTTK